MSQYTYHNDERYSSDAPPSRSQRIRHDGERFPPAPNRSDPRLSQRYGYRDERESTQQADMQGLDYRLRKISLQDSIQPSSNEDQYRPSSFNHQNISAPVTGPTPKFEACPPTGLMPGGYQGDKGPIRPNEGLLETDNWNVVVYDPITVSTIIMPEREDPSMIRTRLEVGREMVKRLVDWLDGLVRDARTRNEGIAAIASLSLRHQKIILVGPNLDSSVNLQERYHSFVLDTEKQCASYYDEIAWLLYLIWFDPGHGIPSLEEGNHKRASEEVAKSIYHAQLALKKALKDKGPSIHRRLHAAVRSEEEMIDFGGDSQSRKLRVQLLVSRLVYDERGRNDLNKLIAIQLSVGVLVSEAETELEVLQSLRDQAVSREEVKTRLLWYKAMYSSFDWLKEFLEKYYFNGTRTLEQIVDASETAPKFNKLLATFEEWKDKLGHQLYEDRHGISYPAEVIYEQGTSQTVPSGIAASDVRDRYGSQPPLATARELAESHALPSSYHYSRPLGREPQYQEGPNQVADRGSSFDIAAHHPDYYSGLQTQPQLESMVPQATAGVRPNSSLQGGHYRQPAATNSRGRGSNVAESRDVRFTEIRDSNASTERIRKRNAPTGLKYDGKNVARIGRDAMPWEELQSKNYDPRLVLDFLNFHLKEQRKMLILLPRELGQLFSDLVAHPEVYKTCNFGYLEIKVHKAAHFWNELVPRLMEQMKSYGRNGWRDPQKEMDDKEARNLVSRFRDEWQNTDVVKSFGSWARIYHQTEDYNTSLEVIVSFLDEEVRDDLLLKGDEENASTAAYLPSPSQQIAAVRKRLEVTFGVIKSVYRHMPNVQRHLRESLIQIIQHYLKMEKCIFRIYQENLDLDEFIRPSPAIDNNRFDTAQSAGDGIGEESFAYGLPTIQNQGEESSPILSPWANY
ncbi:hypothetical protein BJ508DRAFT_380588 [Ascobolus immersus RN42]|uniref:Uncharacterized protein n=1 Tax=Ascobolus immersus RN42 TaxID=1160509 RepID=A0A3N4HXK1_ASCIM|nr:hypothetical protein BJ508DRAFT_380588 [Ascobolus immersus RN42]